MDDTAPKKYIRTFAGDMEAMQKGSIPDLAPLADKPDAKERLVEASPVPAAKPIPAPMPPMPVPSDFRPPAAPLSVSRPVHGEPESRPSPIETYASDFSDKVKAERASPVTILAAEQDNAPIPVKPKPAASSGGNRLYIISGIILVVLGIAGTTFTYVRYQTALAPVVLAPSVSAPIFVDEREELTGTGAALVEAVAQSVARPLSPGTVRLLYLAPAATTSRDVFSELDLSAPAVLLRNINAAGSMTGIINAGGPSNALGTGEQSPFFILSVATYGGTLAGMLAWETVMPSALAALYPLYPIALAATTTATTTTSAIAGFRDEVVANHDVRVYRDTAGRSVLLYGYWNQKTLVIARNPQSFAEILIRLATSRAE